jgi:hypothetical protein
VAYLRQRGYSVEDLRQQFRCGFCDKEYDGEDKGIFYRRMPGQWKDTPQHRVIFYSMIDAAPLTWQARVIEKISEDGLTRYMLHPYAGGFYPGSDIAKIARAFRSGKYEGDEEMVWDEKRKGYWMYCWSATHTRANPKAEWQPVPPFDEMRDGTLKFKPSKYRTAKYSSRQMMGWDAAVARADRDPSPTRWVVLCEGPLDAARVGPGGVALIGSSVSEENASKIAGSFHVAFLAFDNDKAGREATEKITQRLMSASTRARLLQGTPLLPISSGKDLGDMSDDEFKKVFSRAMKDIKRAF